MTICQVCQKENPAGAEYCEDCGAALNAPAPTPVGAGVVGRRLSFRQRDRDRPHRLGGRLGRVAGAGRPRDVVGRLGPAGRRRRTHRAANVVVKLGGSLA